MMGGIGDWVIKTACGDAAPVAAHVTLAINLSHAIQSSRIRVSVVRNSKTRLLPHRWIRITERHF